MTSYPATFFLPGKLPLNMNTRYHPMKKAQLNAMVREWAKASCTGLEPTRRVRVTMTWVVVTHGRRDGINACATLKPIQDGIVLAGIVPDDTPEFMESIMPLVEWRDRKQGHVAGIEVLIEELDLYIPPVSTAAPWPGV